jgi:hypothetical protein
VACSFRLPDVLSLPDMPKPSKTLSDIKDDCRRFADEIGDKALALILYRAAHDLEMHIQQDERFAKLHLRLAATNGQHPVLTGF